MRNCDTYWHRKWARQLEPIYNILQHCFPCTSYRHLFMLINVYNGNKHLFMYAKFAGLLEMLKYLLIFINNIAETICSTLRHNFLTRLPPAIAVFTLTNIYNGNKHLFMYKCKARWATRDVKICENFY